jgi:hypothetical protein
MLPGHPCGRRCGNGSSNSCGQPRESGGQSRGDCSSIAAEGKSAGTIASSSSSASACATKGSAGLPPQTASTSASFAPKTSEKLRRSAVGPPASLRRCTSCCQVCTSCSQGCTSWRPHWPMPSRPVPYVFSDKHEATPVLDYDCTIACAWEAEQARRLERNKIITSMLKAGRGVV